MEAVMGLELHVHLQTQSKLFCSCSTEYEGKPPNSNTCPICLGYPGSKPKTNRKAIEYGIIIAEALNCEIKPRFNFSRKNYFYPDMPKNFQITQYEVPLAENGYLTLNDRRIGITRIHLEEDPAKLVHLGGDITSARYNLIDYNRSGIPLVEIVTEPDIISTKEARMFLEKISVILDHLSVYDPGKEGALRVDANISIEGGQRVEVKNITGFRNVEKALNYEIVRQRSMTNMGIDVSRETRHFDAETGTTSSLRKKEYEDDYGYITEPDLVTVQLSEDWVNELLKGMPELPDQRIERYVEEYTISRFQSRIIVHEGLDMSRFYEECCKIYHNPKNIANWVVTYLLKSLNYEGVKLKESKVKPETFIELLQLIDEAVISERLGKELIKDYTHSGKSPRMLVEEKNLGSLGVDELREEVKKVIKKNPKAVEDYQGGTKKALDYLLGQVLRQVKARAKPETIRTLLMEFLDSNGKSLGSSVGRATAC